MDTVGANGVGYEKCGKDQGWKTWQGFLTDARHRSTLGRKPRRDSAELTSSFSIWCGRHNDGLCLGKLKRAMHAPLVQTKMFTRMTDNSYIPNSYDYHYY